MIDSEFTNNLNRYLLSLIKCYNLNKKPISINFRKIIPHITNNDRYTHSIHPYPAKLLQQIPFFFLNNTIFSKENDTVLDPFCGTGTVLLEASLSKRSAIGVDVNPLASLIAKVKISSVDIGKLEKELAKIEKHITKPSKYFLKNIPCVTNIEYWYSNHCIQKLNQIKYIINKIKDEDVKNFFLISLSLCCRKFSYSDPKISVPVKINQNKLINNISIKNDRIKHLKAIEENNIFDFFIDQSKKNIKRLSLYQKDLQQKQNSIIVLNKDIKQILEDDIKSDSIQLILTSPPYVSAQKYIRASSLSLQWLELNNLTISELNKKSIGRENHVRDKGEILKKTGIVDLDNVLLLIYNKNKKRAFIAYRYILEMQDLFKIFHKLLKANGYFVLIVGNNTIAGYEFVTHSYLIEISKKLGFLVELELIDDIKSRGLMTKRNKTASIISREHVIVFRKI